MALDHRNGPDAGFCGAGADTAKPVGSRGMEASGWDRQGRPKDEQEGRGNRVGMTLMVEKNFLMEKRLTPEKERNEGEI